MNKTEFVIDFITRLDIERQLKCQAIHSQKRSVIGQISKSPPTMTLLEPLEVDREMIRLDLDKITRRSECKL